LEVEALVMKASKPDCEYEHLSVATSKSARTCLVVKGESERAGAVLLADGEEGGLGFLAGSLVTETSES